MVEQPPGYLVQDLL